MTVNGQNQATEQQNQLTKRLSQDALGGQNWNETRNILAAINSGHVAAGVPAGFNGDFAIDFDGGASSGAPRQASTVVATAERQPEAERTPAPDIGTESETLLREAGAGARQQPPVERTFDLLNG